MYLAFHWNIFKTIMHLKLQVFFSRIIGHMIDYTIWVVCTTLVSGYLMQAFGMTSAYGPFQFTGCLASVGLFELYGSVSTMLMDFEGDQVINYHLMLPTSAVTVFLAMVCYYASVGIMTSLFLLPMAKLILWQHISVSAIAWLPLALIMIVANLFCGAFSLWVTTLIPDFDHLGSLWSRFIFPLWFLGGFQFSWQVIHDKVPAIAYVMLINPVMYMMEGMRAALLGPQGYFNVRLCIGVLCLFSLVCFADSMRRLKKRLDFV